MTSNHTLDTTNDYCSNFAAGGQSDRIAGLIFGHALGDAVGLTTEFCESLPNAITFPYEESMRNIRPCDWTDDTDLLVLTIGSLMENNMRFISKELASRFVYWVSKGLIYTGDTEPKTPNNTFKYIVSKRDYIENPVKIAEEVLAESQGTLCNNSPLTRMVVAGTLPDPITMSKNLCTMTHVDSRCVASSIFLSCIVNSLIYIREHTPESITDYIEDASKAAVAHLDAQYHEEFKKTIATAFRAQIKNFKLGEMAKASSMYKCISCVVYALHIIKTILAKQTESGKKLYPNFKKCIEKIALEGGDADANCAMVGSILGCWLGYKRLPRDWIDAMPNAKSLNQFVAVYISRLFSPTTFEENAAAAEGRPTITEVTTCVRNAASSGGACIGNDNASTTCVGNAASTTCVGNAASSEGACIGNSEHSVSTVNTESLVKSEIANHNAPSMISSVIINPINDGLY